MNALSFRQAIPSDVAFIVDSWVASYRTAHAAGMIAMEDWAAIMIPQVHRVLARPGVKVWVAFHPDEEPGNDIYGWICVERDFRIPGKERVGGRWESVMRPSDRPLVHYCFVKQMYRRQFKIATELMKQAGIFKDTQFFYSCKTGVVSKLPIPCGKWTPLLVRYNKDQPEEEEV